MLYTQVTWWMVCSRAATAMLVTELLVQALVTVKQEHAGTHRPINNLVAVTGAGFVVVVP